MVLVGPKLLSDTPDMGIHNPVRDEGIHAPDIVENAFPGKNPIRVPDKVRK